MNLHYSQTKVVVYAILICVLLPYEFTLLSNRRLWLRMRRHVLLPYEFTLLSNLL